MTNFYYETSYSDEFAAAVRGLAERDPHLINRLEEGPKTIGQLEYQLRVEPHERLELIHKHAKALASTDPNAVIQAAAAFTSDLEYLNERARVHKACMAIMPPRYIPIR